MRDGDRIRLSVKDQRIDVLLSEPELAARRGAGTRAVPERGYARLYAQSVLGPELGCDFDFLRARPHT